ncbi:alkaline phosphatase family protein [bacterium]|nr:alkaline phosphatase family protein [bacterium]
MENIRRLLIIGLDGATFDLIDPWSAQGELPHITALMKRGLRADLESTIPPVTFPAWSSFMTGKNPGKHGIYDFTQRIPGRYGLEFAGARSRKSSTIWRLLSEGGRRVGVMGLPTTYPPEKVNGFMISGFDSPVCTGTDPSFVYPQSLFAEIRKQVGPYKITDFQQFRVGRGWHAKALIKIRETLERKAAIAAYLLKKEPWDCFMVLFGASDTICHHFWMFHDPNSPRRPEKSEEKFKEAILSIYKRLDAIVGQLISQAHPGTAVMILSDHGFGGTGDKVVYLNRWLEKEGLLKFRGGTSAGTWGASILRTAGLKLLPLGIQENIFRKRPRVTSALLSQTQMGGIDWSQTRAFSTEMNTFPAIWINLQGREPNGIVALGREYEKLRGEIIAALSRFLNPQTGQRVVLRTHRREELYHGAFMQQAPDLVLELNLDNGYTYTCLSSRGRRDRGPMRTLRKNERAGAKGQSMNGSHRRRGIMLFSNGHRSMGQRLGTLSIMDMAPTILQFLGLPSPADMDGRVVPEIAGSQPDQGAPNGTAHASP